MDKINFQNGVTKVNADTFNTFQNNIEKAIEEQKGTILFDEENGNSSYEINLLDTVDNYEELDVFGLGDNDLRVHQMILNPNRSNV